MKRMLVVLAAGLLSSSLVAAPAWAADAVTDSLVPDIATAQQVAAFWLGDGGANLRNATPYNVQTVVVGERVPTAGVPADGKSGYIAPLAPSTSGPPNVKTPVASGKVFFVDADGRPHWCTGTAVHSAYRNLVATAGHCVYDIQGNATTLDKWVFVPGYSAGTTPWGLYVGKQASTHYDFRTYTDHDRNYAFVNVYSGVVSSPSGELTDLGRLGDNVGGQGLAFNLTAGTSVDVFGYPAGPHPDGKQPYTGETIESSSGPTFGMRITNLPADQIIGVDSRFTGEGSLGSSWLSSYDKRAHLGYLNGITTSVSDTDGNLRYDTSVSPYFDGQLRAVYGTASGIWTGSIV
ncbi:trypsin-like serine peptidase [Streptosporangium sp. NPDC087985]|uniref:trypsin-like serine peptidase n=1 Tax=Streptosporangium sp. NPDC087985 TaxID=3366196 RepID=UPI00382934BB